MTLHHLMALAPGRIRINGTQYDFLGGQMIKMPAEDYEQLAEGPYRSRLKHCYQEEQTLKVDVPSSANSELEPTDSEELEDDQDLSHLIPFEENAHWQKVKNYVLDLEERIPIDFDLIRAVRDKFPNYASVVAECDRILQEPKPL
ncbi:hypothetical protein ACQ4M3_19045 [Leptolyngbya sp. AN03gr2]|uniref:hypothetical protein n=1 Tax=Leptolyngbya sp. AN03gr2 TaxID=3423364 RepID=UPI003D316C53